MLVLVGGAIAYFADQVGKKLGKKRLSIFGLRPRHTAALGTILLGITISFCTIVLVAGLSKDVRQWITQGRQAIRDRDELTFQRKEEEQKLLKVQQQVGDEKAQIKQLQDEILLGERKVNEQQAKADLQAVRVSALQARRDALETRLKDTIRRIAQKSLQIKGLQASLVERQKQLEQDYQTLRVVNGERNRAEQQSYKLDQSNQKLAAQIESQKEGLAELQKDKVDLEREKSYLSGEVSDLATTVGEENQKLIAARQHVEELQAQISQLNYEASAFIASVFGPSRLQPMIYAYGQEVARLPVDTHLSRSQAQNALESLLRLARIEATAHGAKEHPGYRVAEVMRRVDEKTGKESSAAEYEARIVDELTGKHEEQVVIATSSLNAFKGEVVSLEIEVKANPVAFRRGEVVASSNIDGASSEPEIYQEVSQLLSVRVRDKALQRKMMPRSDGNDEYGIVPTDEMFRTVQTIKSVGRSVRVQAVALDETRVADVLRLDLQLR
jgi:uncharacterized protein (DUF3084 family)